MFQRLLTAIDYDDTSNIVLNEVITIAKQLDARLMLLHVLSAELQQPTLVSYSYPVITDGVMQQFRQQWEEVEKAGLDRLKEFTDKATAAGVQTEFTQSFGDAGQAICALAQNWNADLIVLGRTEKSALGRLIMGSVSQFVTHHAPCSVLLVQNSKSESK